MNTNSNQAFIKRGFVAVICRIVVLFAILVCVSLAFGDEIHLAAMNGDLDQVKALLKEHPKLIVSKDTNGWTPLHFAAYQGRKDVLIFLLANKAEVNAVTKDGWTPLHMAAWMRHPDLAGLLFSNKADVNAKNNQGMTPLHMAAFVGGEAGVEVLLANKATINAKDNHGRTPLDLALNEKVANLLRKQSDHE